MRSYDDYESYDDHSNSVQESKENKRSKCLTCYHGALLNVWVRLFITLVWLAVAAGGLMFAAKFLANTTMDFAAPHGTEAYQAQEMFQQAFPGQTDSSSLLLYIRMTKNESIANNTFVGAFSVAFNRSVSTFLTTHDVSRDSRDDSDVPLAVTVEGYFLTNEPLIAKQFLSPDDRATFILVTINAAGWDTSVNSALLDYMSDTTKHLQATLSGSGSVTIGITGGAALFRDAETQTIKDMEDMDLYILPLAMAVLAYSIRSIPLLVVTMVCTPLSLLGALLANYPVSFVYKYPSFAPSVFVSLVMAMSIDYSLFLLTRYSEEIRTFKLLERAARGPTHSPRGLRRSDSNLVHQVGLSPQEQNSIAVYNMLAQAGHTILVSGSTLAVTFLGLIVFPTEFLSSIGIGAFLTLVVTMVSNLTMGPVLLLTFPRFFQYDCCGCCCKKDTQSPEAGEADALLPMSGTAHFSQTNGTRQTADGYSTGAKDDESKRTQLYQELVEAQQRSCWFRLSQVCRRHPFVVILIVLGLGAPVSWQCLKLEHTVSQSMVIPRNSPAYAVFNEMQTDFPAGVLQPYHFLVTYPSDGTGLYPQRSLYTPDFFDHASTEFVETLLAVNPDSFQLKAADMSSVSWLCVESTLTDCTLSYAVSIKLLQQPCPPAVAGVCDLYRDLWNATVSEPHQSLILFELKPPFDPAGDRAQSYVKETRAALQDLMNKNPTYQYTMEGGPVALVDSISEVFAIFPAMIGATTAIVFILISAVFRSVFLSLRLLLTIFFTLSWIYGAGVLVFQEGILDSIFPVIKHANHRFYWMVPLMSFSILTGLTLDYDVFLMSRVYEYRRRGYSDAASVQKGLYKTGGIISSAGIIMTLAFSSLMLSQEMILNQFGFLLCFGVLIDTFVVRPVLVPAMMFVLGGWNWWPAQLPDATKDEFDFEELD